MSLERPKLMVTHEHILNHALPINKERGWNSFDVLVGRRQFVLRGDGLIHALLLHERLQGIHIFGADADEDEVIGGGFVS